jgi:hypothetical protein
MALVLSHEGHIAALKVECERLKKENAKTEKRALRYRGMFEHAALIVLDQIEVYGLAGDEATEAIEEWMALASQDKGGEG